MTGGANRSYGLAAALCGVLLLWFAVWTAMVNALVLSGTKYSALIWCLPAATLIVIAAAFAFFSRVSTQYAQPADAGESVASSDGKPLFASGLLVAALLAALLMTRVHYVTVVVALVAGLSYCAWRLRPVVIPAEPLLAGLRPLIGVALIFLLICTLYYFGNWPDWDDANYINLATGAQQTHGLVFQYDTMVGDGPGPIHLPTYKFHSFELLGAVLSSVTGLAPIIIVHLIMPLPQLAFLSLLMFLIFQPVLGRRWIVGAIFTLAFLYGVSETYASWGVHGVLRFFQGKGFLITALAPLAAALTVRWFRRGEKIDLLALALCHVCAIGSSANGLYVTPVASAIVAAAFMVTTPLNWQSVRGTAVSALWLAPTISYPVVIAAVAVIGHLYLPSEAIGDRDAYGAFRFVTGWKLGGLVALTLLPLGAVAIADRRLRLAIAVFMPLALLLILNPLGWAVASAVTGNLGFRFLWSIPAAFIAAMALDALCRHVFGSRIMPALVVACASLIVAIVYNAKFVEPPFRTTWGLPHLHVIGRDYADALAIVKTAPANCAVLVPERVAAGVSMIPNAPHQVFVRSLYLKHYRFTMPATELAMRWRLFDLLEGNKPVTLPTGADLKKVNISIGLIAANATAPEFASIARLAAMLKLEDRGHLSDGLVYWRGACDNQRKESE